jgi:hypothetical protein
LESFNTRNKKWETGVEFPAFSDEVWGSGDFNKYLKKMKAIQDNKDYSLQDKLRFTRGMIAEAESVLGAKAKAFDPFVSGLKEEAFVAGTAGMKPGGGGTVTPEQRSLLAVSKEGRSIVQERMKPAAPAKTPAISMYETMDTGQGTSQKFRWNPKSKQHDIAVGAPIEQKEEKAVYRNVGGDLYRVTDTGQEKIVAGSKRHHAVQNAMREIKWFMVDEAGQLELVEKHERLYEGKAGTKSKVRLTKETAMALLKEAKGDKDLARKMAKEQGYSF